MNNSKNYIQKLLIVLSIFILTVTIFSPNAFAAPSSTCPENMEFIPGGEFKMGSEQPEFIEELPVEDVSVSSFCIDSHEITNAEFTKFVEDTGYVTIAERPLSKEQFPPLHICGMNDSCGEREYRG
ncbi:MAG: formylglycine-generating enzyme family protein [Okeania sp. SIO2F4]|nr:formylglycine-generating enzyme family protein [Okeania sp. SIO2F4]